MSKWEPYGQGQFRRDAGGVDIYVSPLREGWQGGVWPPRARPGFRWEILDREAVPYAEGETDTVDGAKAAAVEAMRAILRGWLEEMED